MAVNVKGKTTDDAKAYARETLGELNTSGYDNLLKTARDSYNTSLDTYNTQYNRLKDSLNRQRVENNKGLNAGLGTLSDSYNLSKRAENARRLASSTPRNETSAISGAVDRMNLGVNQSSLYNTYYKALDDINREMKEGEEDYNLGLRSAKDAYDMGVAETNLRKQEYENSYKQAVAQLAEQIQSRWDTNQSAKDAQDAADEQVERERASRLIDIISPLYDNLSTENLASAITKARALEYSYDEIRDALDKAGINYGGYYNNANIKTFNDYPLLFRDPITGKEYRWVGDNWKKQIKSWEDELVKWYNKRNAPRG